ncbi:sugar ABC transporter ATP-binding protein [Actinobacteria bacterium YIM 96077]|uniref:Sugar ABC transporter ATP-binding protein n=1 Tax=Phytoactinopolyspora halophila TaxID=1981511 RepID=A0A329R100_9ACTN|nr:ATP-binding cassette domain-containing protein [Phytoactinopolyspora halophila]AYY11701.1 sugar ABC transporter ATP-binding protein [Actinobacteria bacterium YIM 96077]RAW17866.1 sugar ABC transporter ATP-binding protein [Phytoactinopolyspora halophila]
MTTENAVEPAPTSDDGGRPLLELSGISKAFGAVQALADVDFEVYPHEVLALVGDNGAGKSTLVKTIAGIHTPDQGTVHFDGEQVHIRGPRDAVDLGIETVYQDLALCNNLDVVGNMFLGRERLNAVRGMDEISMEQRAWEVLRSLDVMTISNVRLPVASMSGGQRQSVAVARAVMWDAKVVLLDEPTAALGVAQTQQVLNLIRRLREHGLGVVVISHNLADVFDVADRIVVLRLGRRVSTLRASETDPDEVVAEITGARTEREVGQ